MSALLPVAPTSALLIPRLGSDHDGGAMANLAAIRRTLAGAKLALHDPAAVTACEGEQAPTEPQSWRELAVWCRSHRDALSDREREFVTDMCDRLVFGGEPTERQFAWLRLIYARLRRAAA